MELERVVGASCCAGCTRMSSNVRGQAFPDNADLVPVEERPRGMNHSDQQFRSVFFSWSRCTTSCRHFFSSPYILKSRTLMGCFERQDDPRELARVVCRVDASHSPTGKRPWSRGRDVYCLAFRAPGFPFDVRSGVPLLCLRSFQVQFQPCYVGGSMNSPGAEIDVNISVP